MRRPNLFLAGAPKCGTTALYQYLKEHPAIYMSPVKEPHFFGSDLINRYGVQDPILYRELFSEAGDAQWVGEASVWYLQSTKAAAEIHAYNPDARIVVMLREPVEMLYSLHAQRVFSGNEDLVDFEGAITAEADRRLGRRIPRGCQVVQGLYYRDVVRYADQLKRYVDVFGRERVHVIIYDDMQANVQGVYSGLMEFLELDGARGEFPIYNASKRPRNVVMNKFLRKPPPLLRRIARHLLSPEQKKRVVGSILKRNVVQESRAPIDPRVRDRLRQELAPEVDRLEDLLGRDLSRWRGSEPTRS